MDIEKKELLPDRLKWVKFSGVSFYKDGLFYSRFEKQNDGDELKGKNEFHKVYYHRLFTDQEEDTLIFKDDNPLTYNHVSVSYDESYIFLSKSGGTSGHDIYYKKPDLETDGFLPLFTSDMRYETSVISNDGSTITAVTNLGAGNRKVIRTEVENNDPDKWETIIEEKSYKLSSIFKTKNYLVVTYIKDVANIIEIYTPDGEFIREVKLPGRGVTYSLGTEEDNEIFYSFTCPICPQSLFSYDIDTNVSTLYFRPDIGFSSRDFVASQVFYKSKDGTEVPMYISHKKGLKKDGNNPLLMYAYGGFNISITPDFSPARIALLEKGAIFVIANIRGGGEYGEAWHEAGMKENKQNVFDDFIAAGEYLIEQGYTSKEKLGIMGGSNGGLLVGACMAQRPDLFKVCIPKVGVMDMLRYQKFTIGWGWVCEYGSSDDEEEFKYIYKYSPLHNIKEGVEYPATLVKTADHDDRVVPAHSFKFIAELQKNHLNRENPVLIKVDTNSGHGSSSVSKAIETIAEDYVFFLHNVNK